MWNSWRYTHVKLTLHFLQRRFSLEGLGRVEQLRTGPSCISRSYLALEKGEDFEILRRGIIGLMGRGILIRSMLTRPLCKFSKNPGVPMNEIKRMIGNPDWSVAGRVSGYSCSLCTYFEGFRGAYIKSSREEFEVLKTRSGRRGIIITIIIRVFTRPL